MFDLVIKGGRVVDGSGSGAVELDVGICGEKITELAKLEQVEARAIIDASGLLVLPGFIDAHSHSDEIYLINPLAESKLRQGVTTEVIGNCGSSPFPLSDEVRQRYQEDIKAWGVRIDWTTVEEFFQKLEQARPAVNIVPLVGQGTIRASVMGYENRPPTPEEMSKMKELLRAALSSGCRGMSSGLIYPPGCFTTTEELIALAKILKPYDAIYTSHIRGEGDQLLEAIEETLKIGVAAEIRTEVSHLKAAGVRNWGKAERAIALIVNAREKEGLEVGFDRYPYTASATSLSSLLPTWAHQGSREQTIEYIRNPETSERLMEEMREKLEGADGWSSVILSSGGSPEFEPFEGLAIKEIATIKRLAPEVLVFHILLKSNFCATICSFTMNQEETEKILMHPLCVVGTDATARAKSGPLSKGKPHPRAFGTFPKFFRNYVKEKSALNLSEAVAKTTAKTAGRFGLKGRGLIKRGYYADIVVIDWAAFMDTATYEHPLEFPQGVIAVIVNGNPVFYKGEYTGNRPGKLLLS